MIAFMNTVSSVVLALLSLMLFATQGVNANALTDTLTGKMNTPATNTTKNITDQARINQFILANDDSKGACAQNTLDLIWGCTQQNCTCDNDSFKIVTTCLETLVTNKEINNASGTALRTQYGVTCAGRNQAIPGFNGASRLSYTSGLIGGVVLAAVLSVVV